MGESEEEMEMYSRVHFHNFEGYMNIDGCEAEGCQEDKPLQDSKKRKMSDHTAVPSVSPAASSSPSQAAVPSASPAASSSPGPAEVPLPSHAASSSAFVNKLDTLANDVAVLKTEMKVIQEKQDLLLRVITSSEANILAKLYELESMVTRGERIVQFAQEVEEEEEKEEKMEEDLHMVEDQGEKEKEHVHGGLVKEVEKKKEDEKVEEEDEDKEDEKVLEEEEKDEEGDKVVEEEEKVVEEEEKEAKMHEKVAAEEEGKVDELTQHILLECSFAGKGIQRSRRTWRTSPTHPASS